MKRNVLGLLALIACAGPAVVSATAGPFVCDRAKPEAMLQYLQKHKPTLEQARIALSCTYVVGPRDITTAEIRTDNSRLYPRYDEKRERIVTGTFR